jgi:FkbM family methyltransferase
MAFVLHFVRADDWFFDIGANVGSYTLLACAVRCARGVAVEPIPDTYRRLMDNLRLNHLDQRVEAVNCGLGAEEGRLRFSAGEDTMNHALAPGESAVRTVEVRVSTLDELALARVPALIKIDVEGFETPVLQGARATLASPDLKAVIMELNDSGRRYGYDDSSLVRLMNESGFRSCTYDPSRRALVDLGGKNLASGNTLFVRDEAAVTRRLQSAPPFEVLSRQY